MDDDDEHDDNTEEEAANLSNEMTDAARSLVDEYGWTLDDCIDTLKSVLS